MRAKSLLFALLFAAASSNSSAAELTGKIAYVSLQDNNYDIYLINPDGSAQINLTQHPATDVRPTWSPDGARIAFVSNREYGTFTQDGTPTQNNDIYIMNWDGTSLFKLTREPGHYGHLAWSPDGNRIFFTSNNNEHRGYSAIDAHSGDIIHSSNGREFAPEDPGSVLSLAWSPNGNKIAFSYFLDSTLESQERRRFLPIDLYLVGTDGAGLLNLTNGMGYNDDPAWSPDGNKIAFYSRRDANEGIYVMDADGANLIDLSPVWSIDYDPTWSPDGNKIAFISTRAQDNDIFVMNADGSEPVNLTGDLDSSVFSLVWSPVADYPTTAVEPISWGDIKKTWSASQSADKVRILDK